MITLKSFQMLQKVPTTRGILRTKIDIFRKLDKSSVHTQTPSMIQSKMTVDNLQINFDRVGKGQHPVLCMPGALGCIESDFGPIIHKFDTRKFTLITWDPPGYGKSRPPDRDICGGGAQYFHRDANYANNLMKILGHNKYSILGWSEGATTALFIAFTYPESLRKLVIWGARSFLTQDDVNIYKMLKNIDNWSAGMKDPLIKVYGEDYFMKIWSKGTEMSIDILEKNDGDICREGVKLISAPTLIIHGLKDQMVNQKQAQYLKDNIKGSRLHLMPEGAHNLHIRFANDFVPIAEEFLEE